MRWLESIQVRAGAAATPAILAELDELLAQLPAGGRGGAAAIRVYSNAVLGGDISVQIVRDGDAAGRTDLGHLVAEALRQYGLVEHSIWKRER